MKIRTVDVVGGRNSGFEDNFEKMQSRSAGGANSSKAMSKANTMVRKQQRKNKAQVCAD